MTEAASSMPENLPRALQADGRTDPIGVTSPRPRLTWKIDAGHAPGSFRVIGSSTEEKVSRLDGDVFDVTVEQNATPWPGADLVSGQRVWWVVAADGVRWSSPAFVEAPLWSPSDWGGSPITHPDWVRPADAAPSALPDLGAEFTIESDVTRARLYLTGSGIVVPYLNGARAIEGELEPGYSDLGVSTLASAWDVTALVRAGANTIELALMSGIAYLPGGDRYTKFERTGEPVWGHVRLEMHHPDGSVTAVVTDTTWRARLGPIRVSHWYGGESFDEAHATAWVPAVEVSGVAQPRWRGAPPIRVVDVLPPRRIETTPGRRLVDFGVNSAGRPRLRLQAAKPHEVVTLRPSELLADGAIDQSTTGTPIWDSVTPRGSRSDWAPSGVYHGARYWDVTGLSDTESEDVLSFEVMRTDNQRVGSFESSDGFLSTLHDIVDRAVQSNMFSVFTDCPHREKLGWLEQLHYCFDVVARGYDVRAHMGDMVRHMIEAQTAEGMVPNIAPELVVFDTYAVKGDINAFRDDPNWGRAVIEVPWLIYRHYGDDRVIIEALPTMVRYLDYLQTRAEDHILDIGLGDWIEVDDSTPRAMVATHGWASMLDTASKCAAAVGDEALADSLSAAAGRVWDAFAGRFWNHEAGIWGSDSQASWALAWSSPRARECGDERIVKGLSAAIASAGDALTIGEVALPHLIRMLTDTGQIEDLNRLIRRKDAPGYGYQIAEGATSLAESWRGSGGQTGVASQNHFMLGVIDSWLTGDVAGLRQADDSVGWRRVRIAPHPIAGMQSAQTTFDSPQGFMSVAWQRDAQDVVHVAFVVPAHVDCQVDLPEGAVLHDSLADLATIEPKVHS